MRRNWSWIGTRSEEDWSGDRPLYHLTVYIRKWHPGYWWALLVCLIRDGDDDGGSYAYTLRAIDRAISCSGNTGWSEWREVRR